MEVIEAVREKNFDRKLFSLLLFMNIIAALLQIPAVSIILGKPAFEPGKLYYIIPVQIIWTTIVYTFIISIGMNLSERYGYAEPILKSFLYKDKYPDNTRKALANSFSIGIIIGICLLILSYTITYLIPISPSRPVNIPGPIYGFFVSISAGISEETTFRFCILQIFIWLGRFFIKGEYVKSANYLFWTANLLSGIIFGAAHISNLAAMNIETNLSNISGVVFLNCIAGMSFGYIFFKYGLLSAMTAHFSTDIILHVIGPIIK